MAVYHVKEQHEEGAQPGRPQKKVLESDQVRRNPTVSAGLCRHGYGGG